MNTQFLNVDLDVFATRSLASLAQAMESVGANTLHCGRWFEGGFHASFEVAREHRTADATIRKLTAVVQQLPPTARAVWENATLRDFNIGIQAGSKPHSFEVHIAPKTVALVGKLRARISVTIYSPETPDRSIAAPPPNKALQLTISPHGRLAGIKGATRRRARS